MANIFFISDTHFFHNNMLRFTDARGLFIRPNFVNVEHMNETMVENWNAVVRPQDKVYHLGDVACGVENTGDFTELMGRLNGHKRLMLGNHDRLGHPAYQAFEKIELWTGGKFKQYGFVACHIPLRPDQMRDGEFNVHGHIHQNRMDDPRYINVCVEHTDYTPVALEDIVAVIKDRSS